MLKYLLMVLNASALDFCLRLYRYLWWPLQFAQNPPEKFSIIIKKYFMNEHIFICVHPTKEDSFPHTNDPFSKDEYSCMYGPMKDLLNCSAWLLGFCKVDNAIIVKISLASILVGIFGMMSHNWFIILLVFNKFYFYFLKDFIYLFLERG